MPFHGEVNTNNWQWPIAIISLTLGLLVTLQIRSQATQPDEAFVPSRREEDVANLIQVSESKVKELEEEMARLQGEINKRRDAGPRPKISPASLPVSWQARALAGTVGLEGPGVTVTLDDAKTPLGKTENPNNAIVHNEDLLKVANLLVAAGAEAIAINGQRLGTRSEITCAGPTILVNKTRVTPPFLVEAIGDAKTLTASLELRGGVVDNLRLFGITVKVAESGHLKIPPLASLPKSEHAKPLER